jgi:hypothetical protein
MRRDFLEVKDTTLRGIVEKVMNASIKITVIAILKKESLFL